MEIKIKLGLSQRLKEDEIWPQVWQLLRANMGKFIFELLDVNSEQEPWFVVDWERLGSFDISLKDSWLNFNEHLRAFTAQRQQGTLTMDSFFQAELLTYFTKSARTLCTKMVIKIAQFPGAVLDPGIERDYEQQAAMQIAQSQGDRIVRDGNVKFIREGDHVIVIICKNSDIDKRLGSQFVEMQDQGFQFKILSS